MLTPLPEIPEKNLEKLSSRISKLPETSLKNSLNLPSGNYGPFCLKILKEFMIFNNLPESLPVPNAGDTTHVALSKIFDIILHSMGEEKRNEILKLLNEYNMSIPPSLRN